MFSGTYFTRRYFAGAYFAGDVASTGSHPADGTIVVRVAPRGEAATVGVGPIDEAAAVSVQ